MTTTTKFTGNINNFEDSWVDIKTGSILNIRTKGSYPKKRKCCPHHHGFIIWPVALQHKPYGIATLNLDPYDDRPDWYKFHTKKKKRYYEEVTCKDDPDDYEEAMDEDKEMHLSPHSHIHIKQIEQDTKDEEIEDETVI